MTNLNKLTKIERTIFNALIVAGIAMFSSWTASTDIPTFHQLWIGFVAGMLTLLIRIKDFLEEQDDINLKEMKVAMII